MTPIVLYCKSYSTDVLRVKRLAESVDRYNTQALPFYVSAPEKDLPLFREHLSAHKLTLLSDESIIRANPRISQERLCALPGGTAQQVVKSEFWRLGLSDAYLCLDSDAMFIRPFEMHDFLTDAGTPYTMMDEAHDLLDQAMQLAKTRIVRDFEKEADQVQHLFERSGRRYSFGPFPVVWHRAVWESLDTQYLQPRGMSFLDAIEQAPIESRWYGEALLRYKAVPLMPCQALFKVYHYAWQYDQDRKRGITSEQLASHYWGVICQSAWERELDWPREGGSAASRMGRRIRRLLGRI
jgi:Family of unknown function (DUF6492)